MYTEHELTSSEAIDSDVIVALVTREAGIASNYRKVDCLIVTDKAEMHIGIFTGPSMMTVYHFGVAEHELPGKEPDVSVRYKVDLKSQDRKGTLFTISGKMITAELTSRVQEALNEEPHQSR